MHIAKITITVTAGKKTRSTGTMHTSTKAHLTSVAILIRIQICTWIREPDHHQNLIICSLAHCQPFLKFHANPFGNFCANLLTDRQTDRQMTDRQRQLHILLGGGNDTAAKQIARQRSMIIFSGKPGLNSCPLNLLPVLVPNLCILSDRAQLFVSFFNGISPCLP